MPFRRWTKRFILISTLLILIICLLNFLINPFGVFNNENTLNIVKNHAIGRMAKFYYGKRSEPNVLMMGTSRMGYIDPKELEAYEKGNIYNLALNGSGISEQYYNLKYFIETKDIKTVVMGLDFFSYNSENSYEKTSSFKLGRFSKISEDYTDALFSYLALSSSLLTIKDNIFNIPAMNNHNIGFDYGNKFKDISHKKRKKNFLHSLNSYANDIKYYNNIYFTNPKSLDKEISYLTKTIFLCASNNVKLKVYISPISAKQYDLLFSKGLENSYLYWLREISNNIEYYDFSGHNSITENMQNYNDSSHFKPQIGRLIFAKLYDNTSIDIPNDFGTLVNKNTIESHLEKLKNEVEPFNLNF